MAKQYKKPENTKYKSRTDLKDYTMDDKDGGMNPKSAGEKLPNLLRKTDKPVVDNGTIDVKWNADDRLYKDLEDADYDSKTALKRLTKRQNDEAKDVKDVIKDKIENLTREQKERLVREYIRRKIEKVLYEQEEKPEDAPAEEAPEAPTPEAPAPETTPTAPEAAAETPAPETPTEEPAPTAEPVADNAEKELDPEAKEALAVQRFVDHLKGETGNIARIKAISKVINATMREAEPEDYTNFYELLRSLAINKLSTGNKSKK